jgi:hypothetical protein
VAAYVAADDTAGRRDVVDDVVDDVRALRDADLTSEMDSREYESPGNGRGALLADLEEAAHGTPLSLLPLAVRTRHAVGFYVGDGPPPLAQAVHVTFDHRMSYRALVRAFGQIWPDLRDAGIVRQTRPLGERKLSLVRFVCLAMPDASWRERLVAWNDENPGWLLPDTRALITELHDAEKSLTGKRDGFAWFYDPVARLSRQELIELASSGDQRAKRLRRRRIADGDSSFEAVGIKVDHTPAGARPRKARRPTLR